jgi:hypothetical protein
MRIASVRRPALTFLFLLSSSLSHFLSGRAAAQPISLDSVDPTQATTGLVVTIVGDGFLSKPVVFLTTSDSPRKLPLKVTEFTENQIVAVVRRAVAGTFEVNVRIRKETATLEDAFEILGPMPESLAPTSAAPGEEVTITGDFFGTKKGKVRAGEKNARVTLWEDETVRFLVPKLPDGPHDVTLMNKVGTVDAGTLQVTGGGGGDGVHLRARIDGDPFAAVVSDINVDFIQPQNLVVISGGNLTPIEDDMVLRFTYDIANGAVPADVSNTTNALVEYATVEPSGVTVWRAEAAGSFTIQLISRSGNILCGTFSATTPRVMGTSGPATREITQGDFEVQIP